jgi:hypothetical protein
VHLAHYFRLLSPRGVRRVVGALTLVLFVPSLLLSENLQRFLGV